MKPDLKQSLAALIAVGALATTPAAAFADDHARSEPQLVHYDAASSQFGNADLDAVPELESTRPTARERRLSYNARTHRGMAGDARFKDLLVPLLF